MSVAKKGAFSVLYSLNIKQARAFFFVLTTIATSLACYLLYFIRQDIQLWLLENKPLSTVSFSQVRVDDVWVQPNEFVDIGSRLFTLSFYGNQPQTDELVNQLVDQTRAEISEYSLKRNALIKKREQSLLKLAHDESDLNRAIVSIVFYNRIPVSYQHLELDASSLLAALKDELKLVKAQQISQPLHYNNHIQAISRLEAGLSKQLNNLIANRRFELIAKEKGKVLDVHTSKENAVNLSRPLVTISDNKMPSVQAVYLFNSEPSAFHRAIDRRLKKAAFRYLNL